MMTHIFNRKKLQETFGDTIAKAPHYNSHPSGVEFIDVFGDLPFAYANIMKYVWRTNHKNGIEDLKKARVYLELMDKFPNMYDILSMWTIRKSLFDSVLRNTPHEDRLLTHILHALNAAVFLDDRISYDHHLDLFRRDLDLAISKES